MTQGDGQEEERGVYEGLHHTCITGGIGPGSRWWNGCGRCRRPCRARNVLPVQVAVHGTLHVRHHSGPHNPCCNPPFIHHISSNTAAPSSQCRFMRVRRRCKMSASLCAAAEEPFHKTANARLSVSTQSTEICTPAARRRSPHLRALPRPPAMAAAVAVRALASGALPPP